VRSVVEQLVLPAECALCHALLPFERSGDLICPVCRHRWRPIVPPWCARCGQPEPLFGLCRICQDWPGALRHARSAVWLDAAARRAVHALKYGGLPRIADDLAAAMARVQLPDAGAALLVPIPLAARRLRARGYNQSECLARHLAHSWRRPVRHLLVRTRETATQTALTPAARLANVAGAFSVGNAECGMRKEGTGVHGAVPIPNSALSSPLILVDDVFTTGATLAAAARALQDAGALSIMAVTFGRAVIPDFT
jgi:predicted amidophosphoribosyltransferase